ncbi:DNA-binding CsgD family transcriptional regulator [Duganella sp. SG902]|uniref:helix-turn-helix transcriptional regulator n=1 Tax=Duganella sp. SG902 TaxID=2587016 RepID=UPI00159DE8D2|nr:helix-turn-helix transcriptional regulator [Duganella sp. SG902]NVM77497.1 DNA-binding CsgD family transcriptional regulator [Duganella sp. SG902]
MNETIHAIYQSVLEPEPWRGSMALISEYIGCTSTTIVVRPSSATDLGYLVCHPANGKEFETAYQTKWYLSDPFVNLPPERVVLVSDVMPHRAWEDSDYFQQFLRYGMPADADHGMGVDIVTSAGTVSRLRLYRHPELPPFNLEDKRRLSILVPHIKQALALTAQVTRSEAVREIYEEGLDRLNIGVLVLDERAQLLRANPVACHLLAAGDGLRLAGRELETCTPVETRELRRLLTDASANAGAVAAMSLSRPSGRRKMAAVVRRIPMIEESDGRSRPAYAIFLRDPDAQARPAQEITRQLFDFTPAEANFAVELVNGLSLDDAAVKLGIRRNTARAHLRAIFLKAGVTRQSELVRVLLNAVLGLEVA